MELASTPPVRAHVLETAPLPLSIPPDDKILACTKMLLLMMCPAGLHVTLGRNKCDAGQISTQEGMHGRTPSSLVANGFSGLRSSTTARGYHSFVQT